MWRGLIISPLCSLFTLASLQTLVSASEESPQLVSTKGPLTLNTPDLPERASLRALFSPLRVAAVKEPRLNNQPPLGPV